MAERGGGGGKGESGLQCLGHQIWFFLFSSLASYVMSEVIDLTVDSGSDFWVRHFSHQLTLKEI